MGYSGHKHQKGDKELTIVDNNGFVLGPITVKPVNQQDMVILRSSQFLVCQESDDTRDFNNSIHTHERANYTLVECRIPLSMCIRNCQIHNSYHHKMPPDQLPTVEVHP
jgi:hypothetical protein